MLGLYLLKKSKEVSKGNGIHNMKDSSQVSLSTDHISLFCHKSYTYNSTKSYDKIIFESQDEAFSSRGLHQWKNSKIKDFFEGISN